MEEIQSILNSDDLEAKKALFLFSPDEEQEKILLKFNLWGRYFFPQYFKSDDAQCHADINRGNLDVYLGSIDQFIDAAFKGVGKDVKTKLFITFVIVNDKTHFRRYFKVLTEDKTNSTQSVTDIYNMLINPRLTEMYPNTFEKTIYKREETKSSFTTATGIKVLADTIYTSQRGQVQEEARPDFVWFNDFETRKTLRSAVMTKAIWDNMEEARTGLEKGGGCVYTCNYISEMGNVHRLINDKLSPRKRVLIIPITKDGTPTGEPTWNRYSKEDIAEFRRTDDDFEGERLCKPNASKDIFFDRETLDKMEVRQPLREIAGFKMFRDYNPRHRYAGGHDVAGGVGLDSSTSVFIDFHTVPAQVVGTFYSNMIQPEAFGDEIYNEANKFGGCLVAPENNKFDQTILKAKQLGANIYKMPTGTTLKTTTGSQPTYNYGWNTNSLTKSKMYSALKAAVEDGLLALNDEDLIREAKSYTRNDLIDKEPDPRLVTRHFDLLTACAIAWQMKDHAEYKQEVEMPVSWTQQEESANPAE